MHFCVSLQARGAVLHAAVWSRGQRRQGPRMAAAAVGARHRSSPQQPLGKELGSLCATAWQQRQCKVQLPLQPYPCATCGCFSAPQQQLAGHSIQVRQQPCTGPPGACVRQRWVWPRLPLWLLWHSIGWRSVHRRPLQAGTDE